MKLNEEQAKQKVKDTILGQRHQDYVRVCQLAKDYNVFNTGQGFERFLKQYHPREDDVEFEQRKRLTKNITGVYAASVKNPFLKVTRTDRVTRKIIVKGNKKVKNEIEKKLVQKMNLFYGSDNEEGGLDYWLKTKIPSISFNDPNTFIVIEFTTDEEDGTPTAYPFEVNSENALNFEVDNNNVDWMVAQSKIKFLDKIKQRGSKNEERIYSSGIKFTIYCGEFSFVFRRVSADVNTRNIEIAQIMDTEEAYEAPEIFQGKNKHHYAVFKYETMLPDWQMFRVGYVPDDETNQRTFVNPYHQAVPYFEKSIKSVSEYDLTNVLHTYPHQFSYIPECTGEKDIPCFSGYTREGTVCKVCKGTGAKVHTSSQSVVTLPMPKKHEDMLPLNQMMAYFAPPIDLLDFQKKVVDEYEPKIHQSVFNSTVLVQKTVVATATEKDQDMESVYDTLSPFATKLSAIYLNVCYAIAKLIGEEGNVEFVYRYPSDFRMKTRSMLYGELKTIEETNAPSFVKDSVSDELAHQVYLDDPEGLLRYNIKKNFTPFRGKSVEEVIVALNSSFTPDRSKVLYLNFEEVFFQAELEDANFYIKEYPAQKAIIDKIIGEIESSLPRPTMPVFNPIAPIIEEEIEE